MTLKKGWDILRSNIIQRNLFIQGIFLILVTAPSICFSLEKVGYEIDWFGVALGVAWGVAWGVAIFLSFVLRLI